MSFWDRFRKPNSLKNGKKHGKWTEPDGKQIIECNYVHGVRQGPFILRREDGSKLREGTFLDGEIDGVLVIWSQDGKKLGEGTLRAGKMHGHWSQWHESGALHYDGDYLDDQRQGPWKSGFDNGQLEEQGAHILGAREGDWKIFSRDGVVLQEGAYAAGKRKGRWIFRRPDGKPRCEGELDGDAFVGPWRVWSAEGIEREPRAYRDDADLQRWEQLRVCVELLAAYHPKEADEAWINRVKATFDELAKPWQVTAKTDDFGQRSLSAPIGAAWQLQLALGTPMTEICKDECWSQILRLMQDWDGGEAMALVEPIGRYPHKVAQEWLDGLFADEEPDARWRLVSRFEPGRSFSLQMMERFRRRMPHLQELVLRECAFPEGLVPLFDGYRELERLWIVNSEVEKGAIAELLQHLARADWLGKLADLAIVGCYDPISDARLGALLPKLPSLRRLTLDNAKLGRSFAKAIKSVEQLELRDSTLDTTALEALASLPKLSGLTLLRCQLPAKYDLEKLRAKTNLRTESPAPSIVHLKL